MFRVPRLAVPSGHMIEKELFLLERDLQVNYTDSPVNICSFGFVLDSLCSFYPKEPSDPGVTALLKQQTQKMKHFCMVMELFPGRARKGSRN